MEHTTLNTYTATDTDTTTLGIVEQPTITIAATVHDHLTYLANTYTHEIAAFLTGTWDNNKIIVDGYLIPHQTVTNAHVTVPPEALIALRNEQPDQCQRIIGHYHSHHHMGAFWSSEDYAMQREWLATKPHGLFIVGSTATLLISIGTTEPFLHTISNLHYTIDRPHDEAYTHLHDRITACCTPETTPTVTALSTTTTTTTGKNTIGTILQQDGIITITSTNKDFFDDCRDYLLCTKEPERTSWEDQGYTYYLTYEGTDNKDLKSTRKELYRILKDHNNRPTHTLGIYDYDYYNLSRGTVWGD